MSRGQGRPLDSIPHTYYVVPDPRYVRIEALLVIADGPSQRYLLACTYLQDIVLNFCVLSCCTMISNEGA